MGAAYPVVLVALALATAWPLAAWMHRVHEGRVGAGGRIGRPLEGLVYRLLGTSPAREMGAFAYTRAVLVFSAASLVVPYLLQRLQGLLPLNPDGLGAVSRAPPSTPAVALVRGFARSRSAAS